MSFQKASKRHGSNLDLPSNPTKSNRYLYVIIIYPACTIIIIIIIVIIIIIYYY